MNYNLTEDMSNCEIMFFSFYFQVMLCQSDRWHFLQIHSCWSLPQMTTTSRCTMCTIQCGNNFSFLFYPMLIVKPVCNLLPRTIYLEGEMSASLRSFSVIFSALLSIMSLTSSPSSLLTMCHTISTLLPSSLHRLYSFILWCFWPTQGCQNYSECVAVLIK